MAMAKKSSTKKTTNVKTPQTKRVRTTQSAEVARQHSTGVRLGVISLTILALAFLLLALTNYQ